MASGPLRKTGDVPARSQTTCNELDLTVPNALTRQRHTFQNIRRPLRRDEGTIDFPVPTADRVASPTPQQDAGAVYRRNNGGPVAPKTPDEIQELYPLTNEGLGALEERKASYATDGWSGWPESTILGAYEERRKSTRQSERQGLNRADNEILTAYMEAYPEVRAWRDNDQKIRQKLTKYSNLMIAELFSVRKSTKNATSWNSPWSEASRSTMEEIRTELSIVWEDHITHDRDIWNGMKDQWSLLLPNTDRYAAAHTEGQRVVLTSKSKRTNITEEVYAAILTEYENFQSEYTTLHNYMERNLHRHRATLSLLEAAEHKLRDDLRFANDDARSKITWAHVDKLVPLERHTQERPYRMWRAAIVESMVANKAHAKQNEMSLAIYRKTMSHDLFADVTGYLESAKLWETKDMTFNDVLFVLDHLQRQRQSGRLKFVELFTLSQSQTGISNNESYLNEINYRMSKVTWPMSYETFFYYTAQTSFASTELRNYLKYCNHPLDWIPTPDRVKDDVVNFQAMQDNDALVNKHIVTKTPTANSLNRQGTSKPSSRGQPRSRGKSSGGRGKSSNRPRYTSAAKCQAKDANGNPCPTPFFIDCSEHFNKDWSQQKINKVRANTRFYVDGKVPPSLLAILNETEEDSANDWSGGMVQEQNEPVVARIIALDRHTKVIDDTTSDDSDAPVITPAQRKARLRPRTRGMTSTSSDQQSAAPPSPIRTHESDQSTSVASDDDAFPSSAQPCTVDSEATTIVPPEKKRKMSSRPTKASVKDYGGAKPKKLITPKIRKKLQDDIEEDAQSTTVAPTDEAIPSTSTGIVQEPWLRPFRYPTDSSDEYRPTLSVEPEVDLGALPDLEDITPGAQDLADPLQQERATSIENLNDSFKEVLQETLEQEYEFEEKTEEFLFDMRQATPGRTHDQAHVDEWVHNAKTKHEYACMECGFMTKIREKLAEHNARQHPDPEFVEQYKSFQPSTSAEQSAEQSTPVASDDDMTPASMPPSQPRMAAVDFIGPDERDYEPSPIHSSPTPVPWTRTCLDTTSGGATEAPAEEEYDDTSSFGSPGPIDQYDKVTTHDESLANKEYGIYSSPTIFKIASGGMWAQTPKVDVYLSIRGKFRWFPITALPDTGAAVNVISQAVAEENSLIINSAEQIRISTANAASIACLGTTILHLNYQEEYRTIKVHVAPTLYGRDIILGWVTLVSLGVVPRNFPNISTQRTPTKRRHENSPQPECTLIGTTCASVDICKSNQPAMAQQPIRTPPAPKHSPSPMIRAPRSTPPATATSKLHVSRPMPQSMLYMMKGGGPTVLSPAQESAKKYMEMKMRTVVTNYPVAFDTASTFLRPLKGPKMRIELSKAYHDSATPYHAPTPRPIPYHLRPAAIETLMEGIRNGTLEKIQSESTEGWLSHGMFLPKPTGGLRLVVDLKKLNQFIVRPTHPFDSPWDIVRMIPETAKFFVVLDCHKGYWQIEIDERDSHLTAFSTPYGQYKYKRAPMGLASSGDVWCQRSDAIFAGVDGHFKLVDDIICYGATADDAIAVARKIVQRATEGGITLSSKKIQVGQVVHFGGYRIEGGKGIQMDPARVQAIKDFPKPVCTTDVRAFCGLANALGRFAPDYTVLMKSLYELTEDKNKGKKGFGQKEWTAEHDEAFQKAKAMLTESGGQVLSHYLPNDDLHLFTDASNTNGLGFALVQYSDEEDDEGRKRMRLVECGSRTLSKAEKNYSAMEIETLAIVWALLKTRMYTYGRKTLVHSDHKNLETICNKQQLDTVINARVRRLLSRVSDYEFSIEYLPGAFNTLADVFSRFPTTLAEKCPLARDLEAVLAMMDATDPDTSFGPRPADAATTQIKGAAAPINRIMEMQDDEAWIALCNRVATAPGYSDIVGAWRSKAQLRQLPVGHPAREFPQDMWRRLHFEERYGVLVDGVRLIVPSSMRLEMLTRAHRAHLGQVKSYLYLKKSFQWPGLKRDITDLIDNCPKCREHRCSKQKSPMISYHATYPMEEVQADIASFQNCEWLIIVDRLSNYPWFEKLQSASTEEVTKLMDNIYYTYGFPKKITVDRGPCFKSEEFMQWAWQRGIQVHHTSPYHHNSLGLGEAYVKLFKQLKLKADSDEDFRSAVSDYREIGILDRANLSPNELMFGRTKRSPRTINPHASKAHVTDEEFDNAIRASFEAKQLQSTYYNRGANTSPMALADYSVGSRVRIQAQTRHSRWMAGYTVEGMKDSEIGRQYLIRSDTGKLYHRNKDHIMQEEKQPPTVATRYRQPGDPRTAAWITNIDQLIAEAIRREQEGDLPEDQEPIMLENGSIDQSQLDTVINTSHRPRNRVPRGAANNPSQILQPAQQADGPLAQAAPQPKMKPATSSLGEKDDNVRITRSMSRAMQEPATDDNGRPVRKKKKPNRYQSQ